MAAIQNTNPFLNDVVDDDFIEDEIETYASDIGVVSPSEHELSLDAIAIKLIKDNFLLTALELHTELVESGRELPRLRDYFSNPGNFERTKSENTSPTLPRTSSVQTFDSLDFARYSDDGERQVDERVAVLEFELRKAQDTIKSLRASLTREAVENESPSPDQGNDAADGNTNFKDEQIRPLEKRALNFLVNEYLLLNNNKLTSVTFAEENEDQDFEDWDDVGLNIPKPADVLHLYRDYGNHMFPRADTCEVACEAALDAEEKLKYEEMQQELEARCLSLERQIEVLTLENSSLLLQITNHNFGDDNTMSVRSSTPFVTPMNTPQKHIAVKSQPNIKNSQGDSETDNLTKVVESDAEKLVENVVSVDRENIIDNRGEIEDKSDIHNDDSRTVESQVAVKLVSDRSADSLLSESRINDSLKVEVGSQIHVSDVADMTQVARGEGDGLDAESRLDDNNRLMSAAFRQALVDASFHASQHNRIIKEVSQLSTSDREQMVFMLGRCLPHIVPNVLLAKREELIPLIVCTAALHAESRERDKLLNILFNLIKKPDEEQRQMILTGCIAFCSHVGPTRAEAELLPQCWEQLNHKYEERKLLVAEACGALAPYLPHEMRGSLVLSMLQQMLDDKNEDVREATVKSLGLLFGFISNQDKYTQGYDLLMRTLRDPSEKVLRATHTVFLPSFALWSYELGKLEHGLVNALLRQLEELVKGALMAQKNTSSTHLPMDESRFILLVYTLQTLLPFLFLTILESGPFISKLDAVIEEVQYIDSSRFPKSFSPLTDLCTVVGDIKRLSALVYLYEEHIAQEWFEQWDSFSWLVNNLIPRYIEIISGVGLTLPHVIPVLCQFFNTLCRTFGRLFSDLKVKARFKDVLNIPEEELDTQVLSGQTALTTCVVPVFAAGVLAAFTTESDQHQLMQFLQTVLCTLALCPAPLDSIMAAFTELSTNPLYHDLLLAVLWDGVVHTSAQVRCAAARLFQILIRDVSESQLSTQVLPALVTLANDPEISVRVSTIPALGTIIENVTIREMLDKVYMQLQSFLDDPYYREQHSLHMELIHMFGTVGPSSETKFRDDFVLLRLAAMAQANNNLSNETKKRDIALALFEAYSALSCCYVCNSLAMENLTAIMHGRSELQYKVQLNINISHLKCVDDDNVYPSAGVGSQDSILSDQLVQEVMLPGLRCLRSDMSQVAADHEEVVASMIRDFENKLETARNTERPVAGPSSNPVVVVTGATPQTDDMRSRMMNRIKDTTSRAHISSIFTRKK